MRKVHIPDWMRNGIRCCSDFEPIFFLRRRGGWYVDDERRRDQSYSEEHIKQMADAGINMFVVHGYKGFGLEFEKQEHGRVKKVREHCDKHGIRMGTYCQVGTIVPETFLIHYPDAMDWIQRDAHGHPTYYYDQTFRNFPCYNNEKYKEYYKSVIRYLINELKTDYLHFDNCFQPDEPGSCHCASCTQTFRSFLMKRYADPGRATARFGFTDFRYVKPPVCPPGWDWLQENKVEDPLFQEWYEFRCASLTRFIQEMTDYAAAINNQVGAEANVGSIPEANRFRGCGTWMPYLAQCENLQIVFCEVHDPQPRITKTKVLVTRIHANKMVKSIGLGILGGSNHTDAISMEKTLSEKLAFSPDFNLWAYEFDKYADVYKKYLRFHEANRQFYHGVCEIRDVAVVNSVNTVRTNSTPGRLAAILAGQCLIQSGLPFTLGFDGVLDTLEDVKVVILPYLEALSPKQCEQIEQYVNNGGGLIVTDHTAQRDDWYRRTDWGLANVFGCKEPPGKWLKKTFGKGRAVYVPTILPKPFSEVRGCDLSNSLWSLPKNAIRIMNEIEWAAGRQFTARMFASKFCSAEFARNVATGKIIIHLVNYDAGKTAKNIKLQVNSRVKALCARVPGENKDIKLTCRKQKGGVIFEIPEVKHYCLVYER